MWLQNRLRPRFSTLVKLPTPKTDDLDQQPEYPSVLYLNPTHWLVADGAGMIYVLKCSPPPQKFTASIIVSQEMKPVVLQDGQFKPGRTTPFILHAAERSDTDKPSYKFFASYAHPPKRKAKTAAVTFEFASAWIELSDNYKDQGLSDVMHLEPLNGWDLPYWVQWISVSDEKKRDDFMVLCEEEIVNTIDWREAISKNGKKMRIDKEDDTKKAGLGANISLVAPEGTELDEVGMAEVEGAAESDENDNFGNDERAESSTATSKGKGKAKGKGKGSPTEATTTADNEGVAPDGSPYPFSWTQNHDTISISMQFPVRTTQKQLKTEITEKSLSISSSNNASASPELKKFLERPARQLWSNIQTSSSTWSFDTKTTTLQIELWKYDEDLRWPSVFASSEDEEDEEEVPETLDAATLASVRDRFTNIQTRNGDEPQGNHPALPALFREEMDYDLDDDEEFGDASHGMYGELGGSKIGRDVMIGFMGHSGPHWSKSTQTVISLPLSRDDSTIMVKNAVDGLLFSPPKGKPYKSPHKDAWRHQTTSPALSFVLSSKRDLRFVRHVTTWDPESPPESPAQGEGERAPKKRKMKTRPGEVEATVLAFDAGGSGMGTGNVYVYYPTADGFYAEQGVVRVSGGDRGALLGVGEVEVQGKKMVVALCENALVVLNNVLKPPE